MSDFIAVGLITAVILVDLFVYILLDRWVEEGIDKIVTGVALGVALPIEHRRMLLHGRFVFRGVLQIFQLALVSLAVWQLGSFATNEQVAVLAYLCSFMAFCGALGWSVLFPVWYFSLARLLRETEAG